MIPLKKADLLSTLFVGIDISSKNNVVALLDFEAHKPLQRFIVANNHPGSMELANKLADFLQVRKDLTNLVIAMESTSIYGIHVANYLSTCEVLATFHPHVYCLNAKVIKNYKKSFNDLGKNDFIDAFVIADFARANRITTKPWRGSQFLALKRLTRHRLHLAKALTREKAYMLTNIFLKFSELSRLEAEHSPFSNCFGVTASSVLTDFLSTEDILEMPMEELVSYLCKKSRNSFASPDKTAQLLKKAANDSYKLDKCLYEPLTISIASSHTLISTYEKEINAVNKAIERTLKGLDSIAYQCLLSIPGVGPVMAAGILAEIGYIEAFTSQDALAKYAGLVWRESQSGNFRADDTPLSKAGNTYLRYYLIEATSHVKRHCSDFAEYYQKKYAEVKTHQHKRALALTARKFIRLIFGLLAKHQLYSPQRVVLT